MVSCGSINPSPLLCKPVAAFVLILKDTKYSLLPQFTNSVYNIVLKPGNFWPKHKHNWCLMPFHQNQALHLWLIWYKQENHQEYAVLLYWVFPLSYMDFIYSFHYLSSWIWSGRGHWERSLCIERWHKMAKVCVKGMKKCDCLFGISNMVMWDWLCKTESMGEVYTGKAQVVLSSASFTVLLTGYKELRQLCLWQISLYFGYIQASHLTAFPASQ